MNKPLAKISALFELRSMLREMEHEVGLDALTLYPSADETVSSIKQSN
jgi:hypothetical protein